MRENHRGVTKYIIRLNSCINLVKYLIKILSSINFHDYELWLLSPCIVSFCELTHKIYILNTENRNKFVFCLFFLITNNKSISPFFPSKYKKSTRSSFFQLQVDHNRNSQCQWNASSRVQKICHELINVCVTKCSFSNSYPDLVNLSGQLSSYPP